MAEQSLKERIEGFKLTREHIMLGLVLSGIAQIAASEIVHSYDPTSQLQFRLYISGASTIILGLLANYMCD